MKNHTELLNHLIERFGLKSYLEIGVQNPANNLLKIKAKERIGVDPEIGCPHKMTSDQYFNSQASKTLGGTVAKFDLIFLDGLHHADQVKRDFENSLRCLNDSGFIVIHDCLPVDEATTHVPRDSKVWHGDVYRFVMNLCQYKGIEFVTYDMDHGCCVVWKENSDRLKYPPPESMFTINPWVAYQTMKNECMNIVPADYEIKRNEAAEIH